MLDERTKTAQVYSSSFYREEARLRLPRILADHTLLSFIARGSYGDVFLARNNLTGHYRAIKVVWKKECGEERAYQRELAAIKRFEPISRTHSGFVHILHVGEVEEAFFYIMELADDVERGREIDPAAYSPKTLHRVRLSSLDCIHYGITLSNSLAVLHEGRLLHRDIKPSNIIFVQGKPKLADIGLIADAGGIRSFVGTDGFIAPEGPNSFQADIYALGKTLYELATGKDRHEFPSLPDDVDGDGILFELNEIILRACDPDPKRRYASASAVSKELAALEAGQSIQRLRKLERQFRRAMTAAGILFACGILGFLVFARQKAVEQKEAEERQRRFGVLLARGTEALNRGDYSTALKNYSALAIEDKLGQKEHLIRIGSILPNSVVPTNEWTTGIGARGFSGNGLALAVANENRVTIHRSLTGGVLWTANGDASQVALNEEGDLLARSLGSEVYLHSHADGRVEVISCPSTVINVSFSGERLCITLPDRVLVRGGDKQLTEFTFEETTPYQSFLSPSGRILATGMYEPTVLLWDRATGKQFETNPRTGRLTYHADFSEDERKILLCSFDRFAMAWHLDLGGEAGYMPHEDGVLKAIFLPGLDIIATGGLDRVVKLWSAKTYQPLTRNHVLACTDRIVDLAFIPPFSLVAISYLGTNTVWDLKALENTVQKTDQRIRIPNPKVISAPDVELKGEGQKVIGTIRGSRIDLSLRDAVECIALNEDRSLLAVGTLDQQMNPQSVKLFSVENQSLVKELPHRDGIRFVRFSPDGEKLLACDEDFFAILWDVKEGKWAIPPLKHANQVAWGAFSNSGEWIATASADETARLWDASTGEPITPPLKCSGVLQYVKFSPEEDRLIMGNVYDTFEWPLTSVHPDSLSPLLRRYLSLDEAR